MTDVAAVLDECLARIRNGATPDECLAEYDAVRDKLEPLLRMAQSVSSMPKVSPSDEFIKASQERLMALLSQASAQSRVKASRRMAPGKQASAWQGLWQSLAGARKLALPVALALLLVFGASLGALRLLSPAAALASQCTLSILSGSAEVQKPGSDSLKPGADGMTLSAGYRVKTSPNSYALLTFFEGSTLKLEPETDVEIQQVEPGDGQATTIVLKQWMGRTWSRVVKMADPGSHYEINTPSATAIVRGTLFATEVDAAGSTRVATTEGLVSVVAQGEEVQLPPSQQTQVATGTVPAPPATVPPSKSELIITVSTPAIASVCDPTGSSTGNLPSGMSFNQIPGSQSELSDGTQRITIPQPVSGEYLVSLRYLASDAAGFTIQGMSDGKVSFQYGGDFSDSGANGWLIKVNLQVADGSIVDNALSGAAPLGNQSPEKIVTKAEKGEKPDRPAPVSGNGRATDGGSPGSGASTTNEGAKNDGQDNAGTGQSPAAGSSIEPGNSSNAEGNAGTGSPANSSASDQGNDDKGNNSNNSDKGNAGNDDKGNNSNNSDKGNAGNDDKGNNSNNSDKGNAGNDDKGNNSNNSDKGNASINDNSDKNNAGNNDKGNNSNNSDKNNTGNNDKGNNSNNSDKGNASINDNSDKNNAGNNDKGNNSNNSDKNNAGNNDKGNNSNNSDKNNAGNNDKGNNSNNSDKGNASINDNSDKNNAGNNDKGNNSNNSDKGNASINDNSDKNNAGNNDKGNNSNNSDKNNAGNNDKGNNSNNSDKNNAGNNDKGNNSNNSDKGNASINDNSDKNNAGNNDKGNNSNNSDKNNAGNNDKGNNSNNSDKNNAGNNDKGSKSDKDNQSGSNEKEQRGWSLPDLKDRISRLLPR